jgi:predicted transposase/invertase (TIGR01784 family)
MRYLDPKADLTFKRVFGENPDIAISFLNAILPLKEREEIVDIEYLPAELVPDQPERRKTSIVDVRCSGTFLDPFIVRMQMIWTLDFRRRMELTSRAYIQQICKGNGYVDPIYSLNLINTIYEPDSREYYHRYELMDPDAHSYILPGFQAVFVELPKYNPQTYREKKMKALWLRYLTEIKGDGSRVSEELREDPCISKAIDLIEESAYSPAQLAGYEKLRF